VLGQLLEDLVEEAPERRLLNLDQSNGFRFTALKRLFEVAFELVDHEPIASRSRIVALRARLGPASREPGTQLKKWRKFRKEQQSAEQFLLLRQRRDGGYLLFFSAFSALTFWFAVVRSSIPEGCGSFGGRPACL
jgi:hypothetical protein